MHFFLQNGHRYGLLMGHKKIVPFYFKKGSKGAKNSEILQIYEKF